MRSNARSYKSRLVLSLLSLFFLPCACLFAQDQALSKPKLEVLQSEYNFGVISSGTKVKHDFVIRNTGTADLVIQRVVAACGCTATNASSSNIAPGTEGKISVEFDSSGFAGEKYKTVTVYSNDADKPNIVLSLKGRIEQELDIEPKNVFFGEVVKAKGSETKLVTLQVRPGTNTSISSVKTFSKYIQLRELESGAKKRKLEVSIATDAPLGEIRDRVIVTLVGKNSNSINIPVFASIKGNLRLTPNTLSFGIVEGEKLLTKSVKLENFSTAPLQLKEVISDNPAVHAVSKTIKAGNIYVLEVTVDPSKVSNDLRASLQIVTDNEEEKIALSVYGVTPAKS